MSSSGVYRRQYQALASLATEASVEFSTPEGSFNQKFCELCKILIEDFGGTFEPIQGGSFAARKSVYLMQLAIAIDATAPNYANSSAQTMLNAAKAIWENGDATEIPDYGGSFDWRTYQYLYNASLGAIPANTDELIAWLQSKGTEPYLAPFQAADNELFDKVSPTLGFRSVDVPCLYADGVSMKLTCPSIQAGDLVENYFAPADGGAVPTAGAGEITFTEGDVSLLTVNGVKTFPCGESDLSSTVKSVNPAIADAEIVGTLETVRTRNDKAFDWNAIYGHTPIGARDADVFEITHLAGTFDFSWDGPAGSFLWYFYDGTTSTDARPTRAVDAGTSYLVQYGSWGSPYSLSAASTFAAYVGTTADIKATYNAYFQNTAVGGNVADIKATNIAYFYNTSVFGDVADIKATYRAYFYNTAVSGDVADIKATYSAYFYNTSVSGNVADIKATSSALFGDTAVTGDVADIKATNTAYFYNTSVTGDVADIKATNTAYFYNTAVSGDVADIKATYSAYFFDTSVSGNVADIKATSRAYFYNTSVYGVVQPTQLTTEWLLDNTNLTQTDIEQSLINIDASGLTGGTFDCDTGMPTITDPAALAAKLSLEGKGWTINVNT